MNNKLIYSFALSFLIVIYCYNSQAQINVARLDSFFNAVSANDQVMGSVMIATNGNVLYHNDIGYGSVEYSKMSTEQEMRLVQEGKSYKYIKGNKDTILVLTAICI